MTARTFPTRADDEIIAASHMNAVQAGVTALSVITTKGDLVVGDAAGVETRQAVGANGRVLTADSAQAAGIVWEAPRPLLAERQMQVLANMGAATLTTSGFAAAPTVTGTPASADDADGPWQDYVSGGVSGNTGGLNSAAAVCRRDWDPVFVARIKTGSIITNLRYWVGLFSGSPVASGAPALHLAGFRYDAPPSSPLDATAFWRCATDDGGAAPTVTTTTVAIATSTLYLMAIKLGGGSVEFFVNGTRVASHTTDLPGLTTSLSYYATVTTLSAATRNVKVSRLGLTHE